MAEPPREPLPRRPGVASARHFRSWLAGGIALVTTACGDDVGSAPPPLPPSYPDPVPLPGCEAFDYSRCDVRLPECVDNLAQIASCLRGADTAGPSPAVSFLSQDEAEANLLDALAAAPPPSPNHFERALVLLGLTVPSSFEPEAIAERLAQGYAAYYRRDSGELVVIDHGGALGATGAGTPATQALVLHELIHALQDREHDLDAFASAHQQDSDGSLRGNCVIEGEARLHELRLYTALWGIDAGSVDWPGELRVRRNQAEDDIFLGSDLYSASSLSVPYAYGAEFIERVWSEQGMAGVRQLFAEPPASVREILAPSWGESTGQPGVRAVAPLAPEGLTREAYSSLGAWSVYLLARPRSPTLEVARALALSWRGDLLEAYSAGGGQTAASWTIELDTEADAASLASLLTEQQVQVQASGSRLRLLRASGELPQALIAASNAAL